jgi:hypothetical protein
MIATDSASPDLETRIALRHGADALTHMREAIERAAQELVRYEGQYHETDRLADKAKVLNWAIQHLCTSIMGNARIDLAADAQAQLHALATRATIL